MAAQRKLQTLKKSQLYIESLFILLSNLKFLECRKSYIFISQKLVLPSLALCYPQWHCLPDPHNSTVSGTTAVHPCITCLVHMVQSVAPKLYLHTQPHSWQFTYNQACTCNTLISLHEWQIHTTNSGYTPVKQHTADSNRYADLNIPFHKTIKFCIVLKTRMDVS